VAVLFNGTRESCFQPQPRLSSVKLEQAQHRSAQRRWWLLLMHVKAVSQARGSDFVASHGLRHITRRRTCCRTLPTRAARQHPSSRAEVQRQSQASDTSVIHKNAHEIGAPAVFLEAAEGAPPGQHCKDHQDAWREQPEPAHQDAHYRAGARVCRDDGACGATEKVCSQSSRWDRRTCRQFHNSRDFRAVARSFTSPATAPAKSCMAVAWTVASESRPVR